MVEAQKPVKIATFGVRFESYDDFLVEYTDNLRRGFLMLPGVRNLAVEQSVRIKLSLPNRAILYLNGVVSDPVADGGKGTLVHLAGFTAEQDKILGMCVNSVLIDPMPSSDTPAKPINVLLVDDSPSVRNELGAALRSRGLNVTTADNGLLAISAALKQEPDLVLTDVEMPEMDGWTLLRMARARKKLAHIPIVFLTALSDEPSRLQGYRMGVDDYLPKTLPPDEILARIQGVLTRRAGNPNTSGECRGLRGDLQHVRLGSVLAFLEAEKKTGDLRLDDGDEHSVLRIVNGLLRDVKNLGRWQNPHDRVFELLSWEAGQFEFFQLSPGDEADGGPIETPITYLLLEHARREDEAGRRMR